MLRRRTLALALAALLGLPLAAGGCASPTLPLPPPWAPSTVELGEGGMVTIQGSSYFPGSLTYVLNQNADQGVIVKSDANGQFLATLAAAAGNTISIWQEVGMDRTQSASVLVVLPKKKK